MCSLNFWIFCINLIQKQTHTMLVLMFDPRIKDFFILNNYVGIKIATIATTKCDSKINSPFVFNLSKKSSFYWTPIKLWSPKTTINNVWCKIHSRSNCHGTCKFFVFTIICKFKIFLIINFNKKYLNQMCIAICLWL